MAATIGNFSSGDVLTAAQMNTLGMEYVGDYNFTGYGGINIGGLADFSRIRVFLYCYLGSGSSGLYLRFTDGGTVLTSSDYYHASQIVVMNTGSAVTVNGALDSGMRIGSVLTTGSHYVIDVTKSASGPRLGAMWSGHVGGAEFWTGAGTFYNAANDPDGLYIYRTANLVTMVAQVYGYQ